MQAPIACVLGLVTKAIWRPARCCFEWLKSEGSQSWNFREESISQRLKKSERFAFSNSTFTRQHNISLNGTKSKIFDHVSRKCFIDNL